MDNNIFTVNNYRGEAVFCTKERWENHVVAGHPIMEKNIEAVKDTISDPDSVYESSRNPKREVMFKRSPYSTQKIFTEVVVEYSSYSGVVSGELVTAFLNNAERGRIGNVLYRNSKD